MKNQKKKSYLNEKDVNIIRHRLLKLNIMQISGYFQVDQRRYEAEGISHEIDGPFCMDLIKKYTEAAW